MEKYPEDLDRDQSSSTSTQDVENGLGQDEINHGANKDIDDVTHEKPLDGGAVERQMTAKSANPSVNNVNAIPNGGLVAWLQVLGAFFLFFNSWVCSLSLVDI